MFTSLPVILAILAVSISHNAAQQQLGTPWPMPQKYQTSSTTFFVDDKNFKFVSTGQDCDLLTNAYSRYYNLTFGGYLALNKRSVLLGRTAAPLQKLEVAVTTPCGGKIYPNKTSNENYTLSISADGAKLQAGEVWGALRGLETFSQLVFVDRNTAWNQFQVRQTEISDFPRYPHRGLLLDTARHYLAMKNILRTLDLMSQNKMNVLHWHIVDDQSFPFVMKTLPEMSGKGAYNTKTHIYNFDNVDQVIEYGRQRGIRVMPEFDTPGHSLSWGKSHPEILTPCYTGDKPNGQYGPMDPSKNSTFDFLEKFFTEVSQRFPDHYIHLGGDEVSFQCWYSNPNIQAFMHKNNMKSFGELEAYYMQRVVNIIQKLNKGYLVWQEVIDNGVKVAPDTVVALWKWAPNNTWQNEIDKVTKLGYETLLNSDYCWYLDYIYYGKPWTHSYTCDCLSFNGTAEQHALIKGGEASIWAEFVDNTNVISRTWPRAAAVAERLWSAESMKDVDEATPRIGEHRCRMVRRGYAVEEVNGPGFCEEEYID